jgi:hypothetical protein
MMKASPTLNGDEQGLRGFLVMVERDFPDGVLRIRASLRTHLPHHGARSLQHQRSAPQVLEKKPCSSNRFVDGCR